MARKKAGDSTVQVGNIHEVSGEVSIAAGDIYKGFTSKQVSVLIKQITTTFQPKKFGGRSPYKGLDVFEEEDAQLFFGRAKLVEDLVNRVKESRTVFITGPSGSGKSSLVRAGLIHALKQGKIKNSERWLYETIKPGRDPIESLALAFSRLKSPELANYFRGHIDETNMLHECAEAALSNRKDQRLVLFIDQFEEVFTQVGKDKAEIFINILTHAASIENGRMIILFATRSDFVSNCATYPALNALLNQQFVQIGAMQPDELVSAIAQPALRVGLRIDPDLIAQIINDMQAEPGALPLMQFALKDLFESQQATGGMIALTLKDYLQRGGIRKALERHADDSFNKLDEHEQELASSIFSALIEIGHGTQDTRRTALFAELIPPNVKSEAVESVIQKLADARLITTDEQAGKDTVTISHEKLIDAWPWLKKLVNENRDAIALQNEIANDAQEWDDHNQDTSYLYIGGRLANAREKLEARRLVLSDAAQAFITAGIQVEETERLKEEQRQQKDLQDARRLAEAESQRAEEQTRSAIKLRQLARYLTMALVTALIAIGGTVFFGSQARAQAKIALARQLAAQSQSLNLEDKTMAIQSGLLAVEAGRRGGGWIGAPVLRRYLAIAGLSISSMTHDDAVTSVAFSPDGRYIASGSYDGTARVWEVATGREIARMTHNNLVNSVAFSPNGEHVLSGSKDLRVWETLTGKETARMTPDGLVSVVSFSPNGRYVVSGSGEGNLQVWNATTGQEIAHMTQDGSVASINFSSDSEYVVSGADDIHVWDVTSGYEIDRMASESSVHSVAFSPNGKYVVSGNEYGTAQVWELATGEEVASVTHDDVVASVAFSPDSQYVVSAADDIRVWEITGKEVSRMIPYGLVSSVAFSPNGQYILSGSTDDSRLWEVTTGKEVARMIQNGAVSSVAFSPDGKYVVSGSDDHTIRVWTAGTEQEIARMTHDASVHSVAFSPDGKYVTSGSDDTRVWRAATGQEIARMLSAASSVAFSPDSKYVASGDDEIHVWEAATGKEIVHMTCQNSVTSIAFSPNGKFVVSGCLDNTARVWEWATGKEVARMTHDKFVISVAFSPDSKYVISGSEDGTARVWDAATGQEISRMTHVNRVYSVAFSPDGKYVVSGGCDLFSVEGLCARGMTHVWVATTGREIAHMIQHGSVYSVVFSPDGRYVVSGADDIQVWQSANGKEMAQMTPDSFVSSVAFSPNGKYVVSGSDDNTARVWEWATGKEVARMTHNEGVLSVAFSPDGRYIVSGSDDGTARVWYWQVEDLMGEACKRLPRNFTSTEWALYVGNEPYRATCTNLTLELEPTPTP